MPVKGFHLKTKQLMASNFTEYDRVTYPTYTHPQTHPDRMAVLGRLYGLDPAAVQRCRVLEVGCGNGCNLAPMACTLPESEFVGVDLAGGPVALGQEMARELKLHNLKLVHGSLTEVNGDWGKFDYIIAHGFYSWVPREVREHLLQVCRQQLRPQGVAFISYNALPGCYLRTMLREMLLFHVRGFEEPEERVAQARALVRFLALAQDSEDEYRRWLKAELERVEGHAPGHLYHDELAGINDPFYFTQFMETAARHGLQYLAEADYFEMSDHVFRDEVRERLEQLAGNRWLREQYLDFLKCRRFRQTLLCQEEATLKDKPDHRALENFLVGSSAVCARGDLELKPGVNCVFETPKGGKCQTDLPMGKAALNILGTLWPMPMAFAELASEIRKRLQSDGLSTQAEAVSHEALSEFLLRLYAGGVVEFRTWLPAIASEPGGRPTVFPIARWQADRGDSAASLFHIAVKVEDELGRQLLTWLDGTVDHNELAEKVWEFLKSKQALEIGPGGEKEARGAVAAKLDDNLNKLAKLGLFTKV